MTTTVTQEYILGAAAEADGAIVAAASARHIRAAAVLPRVTYLDGESVVFDDSGISLDIGTALVDVVICGEGTFTATLIQGNMMNNHMMNRTRFY